jgi:RHS repeat-associated protein
VRITGNGFGAWVFAWEDSDGDFDFDDAPMKVCYQTPGVVGCAQPIPQTFGPRGGGFTMSVQEPVNTYSGGYWSSATDLAYPGRGIGFAFERNYNSLDTAVGPLGIGWTSNVYARLDIEANGAITYHDGTGARLSYAPSPAGGFDRPAGTRDTLAAVTGGYEVLRPDQVRLAFDATGRLMTIRDRNDNLITFGYTGSDLTTITDTVGRVIDLTYTAGRLTGLAGPQAMSVTFGYDPTGRLETTLDVDGGTTTYTYDGGNRLESITDQNGHRVVHNTYGPTGRVIEQIDARNFHSTFAWDPVTETATMTDARTGQWVYDYFAGLLVSARDPLGNATTYAYDPWLNNNIVTDPRGFNTITTYDLAGNVIARYRPNNHFEFWTYNGFNDPLTYRNPLNRTTTYTYDPAGNLKTVTGPAPASPLTTYNYDPIGNGLLTSVIDPRNKTTTFTYDVDANLASTTSAIGFATTMTYDDAGRMVSLVEPRGNVVGADPLQYTSVFTYDQTGRMLTSTSPLGHQSTTVYDPVGNRMSVTDANDHTTSFEYDDANHLTAVIDADLKPTEYGYDEVGNLTSRLDANLHNTTYTYDLAGRLTSELRPMNRLWSYEYDAAGNVTKVIDPIANATAGTTDYQTVFAYNGLNAVTSATHFGSSPITYAYFDDGARRFMTDASGTSSYIYDELGRLTAYRSGYVRGFDYQYDAAGNLTRRTSTDTTVVQLSYDDDGRMATMVTSGLTTSYGYDPAGNLLTTALPAANGYVESRVYDRDGRLTEVKNQKAANVLSRSTYILDPVGNRLSKETTTGTETYTYDVLDRLTEACFTAACAAPGDSFRRYTYDPVGNRLTEVRDTGTTTYSYDAADQLTATTGPGGTVTYTYDLDGRQLSAGSRTFTWAQPDRLASTKLGNTTTTYTYDGDGLRTLASTGTQNNKKTQYDWDPNAPLAQLAAERNGAGSLLRRYRRGLDTVMLDTGGNPFYFHYDGLGSVVNLTNSTGVTQWTYTYLPYGGVRTETKNQNQAPDNVLRFTGEVLDPTGLYQLRARSYDPSTGRFVSLDPVAPGPTDPYVSAYVYVDGNPIRYTDPSGRCLVVCAAIGAVIGGAVGTVAYLATTPVEDWSQQGLATNVVVGATTGAIIGFTGGVAAAAALTVTETSVLLGTAGFATGLYTSGVQAGMGRPVTAGTVIWNVGGSMIGAIVGGPLTSNVLTRPAQRLTTSTIAVGRSIAAAAASNGTSK